MGAFETTNPFGGVTLIIMSIAGESVAMRTVRDSVAIIPALETGERQIISISMAQTDRTQGLKIIMHKPKNFIEAFPSIAKQFTDLERWETLAQILQTGDGEQMVVVIGRGAGTRQRPDQEETVVDDVEGFGFVSEVMFSARGGWLLFAFLRGVGV